MALSLQQIRDKLLAQADAQNKGSYVADNAVYAFWNIPENTTATIRWLPDGDETNEYFWRERLIINIPFTGIKGQADSKPVTVKVPCVDMWKPKSCPITAEIAPWWKDDTLVSMARTYYRKKTWLFQGLVTSNPNTQDVIPENPIRRFIIKQTIFDFIKALLVDKDLEYMPTDFDHGRDFYLTKTSKREGKKIHANYSTSKWAMKERALTEAERGAITTHGLWNLSSFIPKKPDEAHLQAIMELFTASVNGELYDLEKWGNYYKPSNVRSDNFASSDDGEDLDSVGAAAIPVTNASSILNRVAAAKTVTEEEQPTSQTSAPVSSAKVQTPDEIIAAIRRRQQQK